MMKSNPLVITCVFLALFEQALVGGQNYPEFVDFRVLTYSKFTCEAKGFRCGYRKNDFGDYEMSANAQDSVGELGGEGNNIWSNVASVDDSLVLTDCQVDYCFVRCNYGCHCVLEDGNTTCEEGTPPPQAAPATDPPAVCPEQINPQSCPDMITNAPAGTEYDCYNFCGGNFVSTCDFGGTCASYACDNQGPDGSPTGLVVGCTRDMLNGNFENADGSAGDSPSPSTNGGGTSSGMMGMGVSHLFVKTLAAMGVTAVLLKV
jgi:hypothetical protein